ncbi:hypothetical protein CWO07_22705 [Vibrio splendidus]|uniref:Uncharacterized protein n=1 Tax=Vibrio splendidus TaxID=29497 RepID=A0A2T5EPL6_VIBSP|nr:RepB family plasmid replication initiator protein [Vibrio splendidus]PTP23809.1 hypothetical protein CWO07_22705 [Vibrio splendidus]
MSNTPTIEHLASLKEKPWYVVNNSFSQATFTHLSPQNINILSYKSLLCAICGWQQLFHVNQFNSDLWNSHDRATNDKIPDLVASAFSKEEERKVTLSFEDMSQFCTVSRKGSKGRKTYNKDKYADALRQAEQIHISTEKEVTISDWTKFREKVHVDQMIGQHEGDATRHLSIFSQPEEYDLAFLPTGGFVGHPIEKVEFDDSKPLVTITFNVKFLPLMFATSSYNTMFLDRLSSFKSLAGLRLYDLLYSRLGMQHELEDRGRVNFSVPRWRSFFGINSSIDIVFTEVKKNSGSSDESENPWYFKLSELEKYAKSLDWYSLANKKGYSSLTKEEALIFDDLQDLLLKAYRCHRERDKKKEQLDEAGIIVRLHNDKYVDINTFRRDVFNKAIKEVDNYAKWRGDRTFEVVDFDKKKKKGSKITTSINIVYERC